MKNYCLINNHFLRPQSIQKLQIGKTEDCERDGMETEKTGRRTQKQGGRKKSTIKLVGQQFSTKKSVLTDEVMWSELFIFLFTSFFGQILKC